MKTTSMRGKLIDMGRYIAENPNTVALGNARMNARGDIVGPGGKVVKKREVIAQEYHNANPKAVRTGPLSGIAGEILTPAQAVKQARAAVAPPAAPVPPAAEPAATETPAPTKRKMAENE